MNSISTVVSDLTYSRAQFLQAIEGLSYLELTQIPLHEGWTIKEVLAHVIGWDRRVLKTLPLMLQNRASEVAGVNVDEYNQQSVEAGRDKSLAELLGEVHSTHAQILEIIAALDPKEIDLRRERHQQIITIRSYVIDVMIEHDREHAAEIELWRKNREQSIDPKAITLTLQQNRADFWAAIAGLSEADLLDKTVTGSWSVKDIVSHVADWEQLMLEAARHIHDPSLPPALPAGTTEEWNTVMAAKRVGDSWEQASSHLIRVNQAVDRFVAGLKMGDWTLRGPYPWPDDRGTLAELLNHHISLHYPDHIPDLQAWCNQKLNLNP